MEIRVKSEGVKHHIGYPRVGLIFGKFYPLHRGHIYMIEKASTEVDILHIMLGCEIERDTLLFKQSRLPRMPTGQDRLSWLKKTFQRRHNIKIHRLDEEGILPYPYGWEAWSAYVKEQLQKRRITPMIIFTSEKQDRQWYARYFGCMVRVVDESREYISISATQIRHSPYVYWNEIAEAAQPFFVKHICIPDHPSLPNAAVQFAAIFNTVYINQSPKDAGVWIRASRKANRYIFTNILLQNISDTVKNKLSKQMQRPWFLPTDCVIPTHKWSVKLDSDAVFCRIVEQLKSLRLV